MSLFRVDAAAAREALRELDAGLNQAGHLALRAAVKAADDSAKGTTLWKDSGRPGGTRSTIKSNVIGERGFVRAGGAARFLEDGTPAHDIPGNPLLKFRVNGQWVSTRLVKHPGTAERPFMQQASTVGQLAADYGAEYFAAYAIAKYNA